MCVYFKSLKFTRITRESENLCVSVDGVLQSETKYTPRYAVECLILSIVRLYEELCKLILQQSTRLIKKIRQFS